MRTRKKINNKTEAVDKLLAIAEQQAVIALRRGNTMLLENLMQIVAHECVAPMTPKQGKRDKVIYHHYFLSVYEDAFYTLMEARMMKENGKHGYLLLWDKLEARKTQEGF